MIPFFALLLLLAAVWYGGLIGAFALGFRKVRERPLPAPPKIWPAASVIVAARDEAETIDACLGSLLANDYPADRLEIIVVDDGSTDATAAIVHRVQQEWTRKAAGKSPELRLIQLSEDDGGGHKQAALAHGIRASRGSLLLTTDADCTVGLRWIRTMVRCFTPEVGFVAGPVRYRPGSTLFGRMQALEFLALVATGAGGIGLGRPNMCNGANVAYRRDVFERHSLNGPPGAAPAADEIMAQRLAAESPGAVRFCAHADALVDTDPVLEPRGFWAQRKRWAATGPRYPRPTLAAAVLGVYAFYVLLLGGLLTAPFVAGLWPAAVAALLLKIGADASLLYPACRHFGQARLFRLFGPGQPIQLLYVVGIGAAAAFRPPRWKGRTLR